MSVVSDVHKRQFSEDGYCILTAALPQVLLQLLRDECDTMMANTDRQMDEAGVDVIGSSRRGLQYFPGNVSLEQPGVRGFLFSEFMADVCRALVGPDAYLFWEQFAVKFGEAAPQGDRAAGFQSGDGPSSLGRLSWHQDSGYVAYDHDPYLTVWVALDDVTADNGAVRLIPFRDVGIRTRVQHVPEPCNGDLVGYFGPLDGVPAIVPAGTVVCFSSTLFHSSDRNLSGTPRRAFIAQYSGVPIMSPDGSRLWNRAERLLDEGRYVPDHALAPA